MTFFCKIIKQFINLSNPESRINSNESQNINVHVNMWYSYADGSVLMSMTFLVLSKSMHPTNTLGGKNFIGWFINILPE